MHFRINQAMAPTIQRHGGGRIGGPANVRGGPIKARTAVEQEERRTDLICKVKYSNTLPDIPFDPKFITYPFDSQRFISYNSTG